MLVTHIYLIIVSILLITQINAKLYSREIRSMRLRHQKSWVYLDCMRFVPGQGSLQTPTIPSRGKYSLTLTIIPQRLWQKQIIQKCQNIKPVQDIEQISTVKNQPTLIKQYITIPLNVQNSLTASSTLTFTILEQASYYFVLTDCNKTLINQYFNQKSRIDIELDLKSNGHNYGSDQSTYTWLIPVLILIYYCLIHLINKTSRQYQDTNWPVVIIKIILWSQLVALCFQYFGHFIYIAGKGNSYGFFGFLYLAISSFSQVMLLGLVTFCAFGWMTTYKFSDREEVYYPIASVFGFIYIVLVLISKINDGQPQKTHLYDSIPIYINFIIKLIVLIIFLIGIFLLYTQNKKNKPFHTYILYLLIFGIFCFVTIPFFITIFVNNISKHNRWSISFNGVQIIKLIQVVIICWQAYDVNSVYRKFTIHGRSFMESQNKYL